MSIEQLTKDEIAGMSYNDLIGVVRETNRPPGGLNSIIRIAQQGFITDKTRILGTPPSLETHGL